MNIDTQIGMGKNLRDELVDNIYFRYELKNCLKNHLSNGSNKIENSNCKIKNGIIEAEYAPSIGKITIYQNIRSNNILIVKSDKTKSHPSATTDERQTQNQQ